MVTYAWRSYNGGIDGRYQVRAELTEKWQFGKGTVVKSIGTQFSLAVAGFAIVFCGVALYRIGTVSMAHVDDAITTQAALGLEFNLAIQEYANEMSRRERTKGVVKDDFLPETICTSCIARKIFEKVRRNFPDYMIKFSSDNPHNAANKAGPDELELLDYFRRHPNATRWSGKRHINGIEYHAFLSVRRIEQQCLRCHGSPENAPQALRERYPGPGGFHYGVGNVAGMDVVGIPMGTMNAEMISDAKVHLLATAIWLAVMFGAILIMFRYIVARRLLGITRHFREASLHAGDEPISPLPLRGNDEIGILAQSYNTLAARLQASHESLEERVRQRTAELQGINQRLQREVEERKLAEEALRKEQTTLKHLLRSSDHERQLIAYEIHDGLAQQLTAAIMYFQSSGQRQDQDEEKAAAAYGTGVTLLRQSLAEARRLISGVRPPILDELGVVAAIDHLIHDCQARRDTPQIAFHSEVEFDRLAPIVENAIYRIAQEGLSNALAHSRSKRVQVDLVQAGTHVRLRIQDWGIGFQTEGVMEDCFGLDGIRERARLLGGIAEIASAPGEGTCITVDLPIP